MLPSLFSRARPFERTAAPCAEPAPDVLETAHGPDGETLSASAGAWALAGCAPHSLAGSGLFERVHVQDRVAFRKTLADARSGGRAECTLRLLDAGHPEGCRTLRMRAAFAEGAVRCRFDVAAPAADAPSRPRDLGARELEAPLAAIVRLAGLLRGADELPPARRRACADLIHGAGTHCLALCDELSDGPRSPADARPVLPCALVEECAALMRPLAAERALALRPLVDRGLPPMLLDAELLRRALHVLLAEACARAPEGSTVTLSVSRDGDAILWRVGRAAAAGLAGDAAVRTTLERLAARQNGTFERGGGEGRADAILRLPLRLAPSCASAPAPADAAGDEAGASKAAASKAGTSEAAASADARPSNSVVPLRPANDATPSSLLQKGHDHDRLSA